jgi:PAS domain S-box-containing protein
VIVDDKIKFLLIESRPERLRALREALEGPDYVLVTAASQPEALARAREGDYAAVLVGNPRPTGLALALRQIERARYTPILILGTAPVAPRCEADLSAVEWLGEDAEPARLRSKAGFLAEVFRRYRRLEVRQERLRQSEESHRRRIESARDILAVVEADLTIAALNPAFARTCGRPVAEWIGRGFLDLVAPEDVPRVRAWFSEAAEYRSELLELRLRCQNDRDRFVELAAEAAADSSGRPQFLLSLRDITARRHAERERKVREVLELSNRDLRHFARLCSHDMQEPLRQVTVFAQLLERRCRGLLDDESVEYLEHIVQGAVWMSQLVGEVLSYSRLGEAGAASELVAMGEVLETAVLHLGGRLGECGGEVTWATLPRVTGNRSQLIQLLQNLIANAVKFRGAEPLRVHVHAVEHAEGWEFVLRDNGIGFEMAYADRIFQVFQRLHGRGEFPGTGMGLAICKRIVERHGGHIWADSRPGAGSTFHFTLPAGPADQGLSPATVRSPATAQVDGGARQPSPAEAKTPVCQTTPGF